MRDSPIYKNLLKDTINYLETLEESYIETNDEYFKTLILKNEKLSDENKIIRQTKKEETHPKKTAFPEIILTAAEAKEKNTRGQIPPLEIHETKKETVLSNDRQKVLESKKVKMEERPQIIEDDFADIKKAVSGIGVNITITDEILNDKTARQNSQKYKLKNISADLAVLAYRENENHYKFLEKIAIALNNYFYPAKVISAYVIEKENNWEMFLSENAFLLIISSERTIIELPNLRKHYRENLAAKEKYLNNIPVFLLPDIALYLKEPSLKISLFKTLRQKILSLKK